MPSEPKDSTYSGTKNAAYLVYSEWGPQLSVPRHRRLAQEFPEISAFQRAAWLKEFKRLDKEIWIAAEKGGPRTTSFEDFKKSTLKTFAWMNEVSLSRAWTLCGYFTWHEGY